MRNRNSYSTEFKIATVEELKHSNLPQKQFCEKRLGSADFFESMGKI